MPFVLDSQSTIRKPLAGAVDSVGASKVAVVTLPIGPTYKGLILQLTIAGAAPTRAQIESMLTLWRLTLSGTEIFTLSGTQLVAIIEFYRTGVIGATGFVYIPFDRIWMRDTAAVVGPAIGTVGETSFSLEITQDATNTIDAITAIAVIDPKPSVLGAHVRYRRVTPSLPAAGLTSWSGLYRKPGDFLYALHLQVSTLADLTNLSYIADGVRLFDLVTQNQLNRFYAECHPVRTSQATQKFVHLDFCLNGYDYEAVPLTMIDQIVEFTFANAPTVLNVIAEIGTTEPTQAGLQYAAQLAAAGR